MSPTSGPRRMGPWAGMTATAMVLGWAQPMEARLTRIVIDDRQPLAGQSISYEQISGRAFGELDPKDPRNAIIRDLELAKEADGKVRYVATFVITKPVDMAQSSGLELGGVPLALNDAPLGTYLGWNITAGGARPFHQGQICNYAGGMIPFAKTRADRLATGDPRLSLEERYGNHAGYVAAVKKAAASAVAEGFLLQADADVLMGAAAASNVLKP